MSARGSPERAVQVTLRRWLEQVLPAGSLVIAVKNEHAPKSSDPMAQMRFFQKRKAEGVKAGAPDLICFLPMGKTVSIEVKAPKVSAGVGIKAKSAGIVSEDQAAVHDQLTALGHTVGIATSIETARSVLYAAGVQLRESPGQMMAEAIVRRAKPRARLPADAVPF